ncbi:MAG: phosphatase PAP2 family protein [Gammaproteobacteria bacterium]|nr:phosphatase PAP2 family protein [Gammaproteobacteria bacterium]
MNSPQLFSLRDPWVYTPLLMSLMLFSFIILSGNNTTYFLALNSLSRYTGDALWAHFTVLGDAVVAMAVLLAFAGRKPALLWSGILAALLATAWAQGLKDHFDLLRPPAVLPAELLHIIGPALQKHSFPSGHTTTIFALAAVLCMQFHSLGWRGLFILIAVLAGISRAVVGVHWPLDILAGAFGGWLSGVLGFALATIFPWGTRKHGERILAALFMTGALYLALRSDPVYVQTQVFQITLAVLSISLGGWGLWRQRNTQPANAPTPEI